MYDRSTVVRVSLMSIMLATAACSSTAKNNEIASASMATPTKANPAVKDQRIKSESTVQNQSGSSLDALRRGESTATPAGSPLKEIFFDFDSYDLSPDSRTILKAAAVWLKQNPSVNAEIEGHCDARGTTEYNLALGAKRAQAAKSFLVSLGIAANRLSTMSYGEE